MYLLYPKKFKLAVTGSDLDLKVRNVHNFLMTVRPYLCGLGTEMLLILKKNVRPYYSPIYSDMTVQRNVPRFFALSICG